MKHGKTLNMHSKKHILHLIETVGPGGAETVFADILEYMKYYDAGNDHIAGFIKDGWIYQHVKKGKHTAILLKTGKFFDYILIKELLKLIKDKKIDLIHSHLPDLSFYSSIAARITNIPHVMTEHGDACHFTKNWSDLIIKYFFISLTSQRIVCVSEFNKKVLIDKFPWMKSKIIVIYNGIKGNDEEKTEKRELVRKNLDIKKNEIAICNVGNLYPVKGQRNLIEAMKNVLNTYPSAKLFIIGRGELETRLKKTVKDLYLENYIHFLGFRKDVNTLLKGMDLFVLPSYSEGLPVSVIEAMDAGLPVIACDVGGLYEFKMLGGDVELVPNNSPDTLTRYIKKFLKTGLFYSNVNKYIVKKHFSVGTMAKKYLELYNTLIKNNKDNII